MKTTDKQLALNLAEIAVGTTIGLILRKKMVDSGMIKGFFTPNFLIRKPGTFTQKEAK